ncbi:hypothetical protein GSF04_08800 [Pseudoalteromonas sp. A22]|uniref:hypothetical protein n=1 Tax=Pseudoalteromonas TaxID=53246 RepID=UPI001BA645B3|nr:MULTISPECIES: hypothetical protein [Pseudoalteromonas]QUI62611.1 hypothetical protein GSF04_08800 [Pseudoalteromonas sp. A22]
MRFDIRQGGQTDTVLFGLRFKNSPLHQKISIRMLSKKNELKMLAFYVTIARK